MDLFPEINKNATVDAVKGFFLLDELRDGYSYQQLKRYAGAWGELKSPLLSATGISGSSVGNSTENRYIKHAECFKAVQAVEYAVKGCDKLSQQILSKRYIDQLKVWQVRQLLGIDGNATWKRLDERACLHFSECMETMIDLCSINRELVPEFQIYV